VTVTADPPGARTARVAQSGRSRLLPWLGLVPFLIFSGAFLLIPTFKLILGSLQDSDGNFTLSNYEDFSSKIVFNAYQTSIEISLVTAIAAAIRSPSRYGRQAAAPTTRGRSNTSACPATGRAA